LRKSLFIVLVQFISININDLVHKWGELGWRF
jgi:hypothetical protein